MLFVNYVVVYYSVYIVYSCVAKCFSESTLWRTNRIYSPRYLCHRQEHHSYGLQ